MMTIEARLDFFGGYASVSGDLDNGPITLPGGSFSNASGMVYEYSGATLSRSGSAFTLTGTTVTCKLDFGCHWDFQIVAAGGVDLPAKSATLHADGSITTTNPAGAYIGVSLGARNPADAWVHALKARGTFQSGPFDLQDGPRNPVYPGPITFIIMNFVVMDLNVGDTVVLPGSMTANLNPPLESQVPEPATFALVALGAAAITRWRQHR